MKKKVKATEPFFYKGQINFKNKAYLAWQQLGYPTAISHYPPRFLHGLFYKFEFPKFYKNEKEARLRFMQPYSLAFDCFPDYMVYEIIPFLWDCWPNNYEKVLKWLKKHKIKTAIFTSSQIADLTREYLPEMNVLSVTEGIDVATYKYGRCLVERNIDFLEYGREIENIIHYETRGINYVRGKKDGKIVFSNEQLIDTIADSKIAAAYPKSWTNPENAGGIETLTQRYWECMLSRTIMIGHAPKELISLLGYNPVIELDKNNANNQLRNVLANIHDYQNLADKNRNAALKFGDWIYSIKRVKDFLCLCGYIID